MKIETTFPGSPGSRGRVCYALVAAGAPAFSGKFPKLGLLETKHGILYLGNRFMIKSFFDG